MISGNDLASEVLDVGKAIGLFDDSGNLQTSWFENPLSSIESLLSNSSQRAAFLSLLDAFLPPAQVPDVPTGESWHPLLGDQPRGNAYLTVKNNGTATFGFAGLFQSDDTATPLASLRAHLPISQLQRHVGLGGRGNRRWPAGVQPAPAAWGGSSAAIPWVWIRSSSMRYSRHCRRAAPRRICRSRWSSFSSTARVRRMSYSTPAI